ncbi:toxin-antitoxin system HicB family antitoxin [Indioceanicola profundi]|uniref:toxin-antitoxin system HicB family antitoxin n=1 Tax=Indioceanicola profundi TaxID=2220096 RepID=UPI000E6AC1A2|nr:toxin-antitoxin system HicB family antitoxin [Indioceanicola profundi]
MTSFPLRLPEDLKAAAAAQAAKAGISLNQYIALAVAGRVAAQSDAERSLAVRAARAIPGRARAVLAKAGQGNEPRPDDRLED